MISYFCMQCRVISYCFPQSHVLKKKLCVNVAVPPAPFRVPSQWNSPQVSRQSCLSANDMQSINKIISYQEKQCKTKTRLVKSTKGSYQGPTRTQMLTNSRRSALSPPTEKPTTSPRDTSSIVPIPPGHSQCPYKDWYASKKKSDNQVKPED